MGGINEAKLQERSVPEIRDEIRDAYQQAGKKKFILSPGCTSAPQTPQNILHAVKAACVGLT